MDIFHVCGIDFMGQFLNSFGNGYIVLCVSYVSKWVHAIAIRMNNSKVAMRFLRENIFAVYGMPRGPSLVIKGPILINRSDDALLKRYSILHHMETPYRPQTNG